MAVQVDGELEALLENGEGLSDKNQVLSLSRLMVRIETLEQKLTCLKLIQVRSSPGRGSDPCPVHDSLRGRGGMWEEGPALVPASQAQPNGSRIRYPSVLFPSRSCSGWNGPAVGFLLQSQQFSHSNQAGPAQVPSSGSAMEQFSMVLLGSL